MKTQLRLFLLICISWFAFPAQAQLIDWTLEEFQPNIPFGGRANTIAVNPTDNRTMFVASEAGGLFVTTDGGITWSHVETLSAYYMSAVAYVTSDILLATATDWFSAGNDSGGIWRSADGGATWSHIANPASVGAPWRFKANEISIAPDTGHIYVATSWGVLESNDQGINWSLETPFGNFEASSVAAQVGNVVIASTFDSRASIQNVARSEDGGATWSPTNFPVGITDLHALAASPLDARTFYAYGDPDFFVSEDAGATWSKIASSFSRGLNDLCGGNGFVKALEWPAGLTLWLGNRCHVAQLAAPQLSGTSKFDYTGIVSVSTVDHWDSRDIAFDTQTTHKPILLATDGGVHRTSDDGQTWALSGSGPNGYNALEIAEVKGQWIDNAGKYDLYLAAQDNGMWASGDEGVTWPPDSSGHAPGGPEGLNFEMQKHVLSPADSVVTANVCGACTNRIGGRVLSKTYGAPFSGMNQWPDPPGPVVGHPTIISKSFHDQAVAAVSGILVKGFAATHDLGATWAQYAVVPEDTRDIPKLSSIDVRLGARKLTVPVQYQAIRTGYDYSRGLEIVHLVRLTMNPRTGKASVYYPAMNGFGSIGTTAPYPWRWYWVFGVDPKDSEHLIAPDLFTGKVMESHDGGDNWGEIIGLSSMITDAGRFKPTFDSFVFASHVSFSNDDPNSVALGTQQNGLFVSRDRGATWTQVPHSGRATAITSVEWKSGTEAYVSTLGRGLWKLTGNRVVTSVPSLCVIQACLLKYVDKGDPTPDRFERGIVVFDGEILGGRLESGVLRELSVTPQASVGFVGAEEKLAVRYTNERTGFTGIGTDETFAPRSGRLLAGLALDKRGRLFGALFTRGPIPLSEKSATRQNVNAAAAHVVFEQNGSPIASKPYVSLLPSAKGTDNIAPGEPLTVTGERMPRGTALEILLDGRPVQKPEPNPSGVMKIGVNAPQELGLHTLVVRNANSGQPIDGTTFVVHPRDVDSD
jgi:photosystem II stability/assembly factor-like uncharacterized protein